MTKIKRVKLFYAGKKKMAPNMYNSSKDQHPYTTIREVASGVGYQALFRTNTSIRIIKKYFHWAKYLHSLNVNKKVGDYLNCVLKLKICKICGRK